MVERNRDDGMPPEVLASWSVPEPAAGFEDRVAQRIASASERPVPRVRRRSSSRWLGVVAGLALVGGLAWLLRGSTATDADAGGAVESAGAADRRVSAVDRRTELSIGARAVAVAESGASVGWRTDPSGTSVQQQAGAVFYRVDRGEGTFAVATPHGRVVVEGTCLSIFVGASRTDIDVHEGVIELQTDGKVHRLHAGERGHLGAVEATPAASDRTPLRCPAAPACAPTACSCPSEDDAWPGLVLDDVRLRGFADMCRVVADSPPLHAEVPAVTEAFLEGLQIGAADASVVRRLLGEQQASLRTALEAEYVAATGESADGVAFEFLVAEIEASASELERAQARQRLAQARANASAHDDPGADEVSSVTPYEQAYRRLMGFGDAFERALAESLGASRARALRSLHDGWASGRTDEDGCP